MEKTNLVEIKNGEIGTGLLIEHDGYISSECGENKKLFEEINSASDGREFHCPYPFVVSAVLQKFGVENANGRIYPENILKREAENYLEKIKEKMAIGECYRPEAMILTEKGWKHLYEVSEGENILTLNTETNNIEIKPIKSITKYAYDGNMINIKGRQINDVVTPDHGFPLYDRNNKFRKFVTAKELMENDDFSHFYIPKTGNWIGRNDEFITIPKINESELGYNIRKDLKEKYTTDLVIPMDIFAKFMGIYLSEGSHSKKESRSYKINIHQKKESVCIEIEKMLTDWGIKFSINKSKTGSKTFVISDMRLCKYVQQFGLCYDKFVPEILKNQSKETLRAFYDWFVMGDGRVRGDKRCKGINLSDDVFSTSKKLALDLNEIQLKIGYSGTFSEDDRQYDRKIEDRTIKAENSHKLYFTYKSLTKGIYTDKRFMKVDDVYYKGDVMCVEVDNHVWYVMDNNRCHWTKNCNHPSDSVIDLSRVAINVLEMHWEGHTLLGKLEIITSPGFRKHGIITCQGDQIANLILQGIKVGVSSRGLGTVTNKMGVLYVSDDFELVCFDVVSSPSTPGAWITKNDEIPRQYIESVEENPQKNKIFEDLDNFKEWLND
jgi:hypothetical protein